MNTHGPEYKAWLDSLKVGDLVCTVGSGLAKGTYTAYKIKRITPTRRFILTWPGSDGSYETKFDNNGQNRQSSYHWSYIEPITEELRNAKRDAKMLRTLEEFKWKTLTSEQLRKAYAFLGELTEKVVDETIES